MRFCTNIERNSPNIHRSEQWFKKKVIHKNQAHVWYQYTFSVSLAVFEIIKQKGFLCYIPSDYGLPISSEGARESYDGSRGEKRRRGRCGMYSLTSVQLTSPQSTRQSFRRSPPALPRQTAYTDIRKTCWAHFVQMLYWWSLLLYPDYL
jgi:hypothetical protein